MNCKICNSLSTPVFKKKILSKYDVDFFKCSSCGFLHTEEPYWLEEAYKLPFTPLDVTIISRPTMLSQVTEDLILKHFNFKQKFLDYGGGVGVLTRMMRDRGLDFYRQDKYAQNLFAQYFDISDLTDEAKKFELITCFEVLEHLADPMKEISEIFSLGNNVLFSTMLQPSTSTENLESWFYIFEICGQHISFFTEESMQVIAKRFGCHYYPMCGGFLHLFTPKEIADVSLTKVPFQPPKISRRIKDKMIRAIDKVHRTLFEDELPQAPHPLTSLAEKDSNWILEQLER
jgi:Methyltransferase domain